MKINKRLLEELILEVLEEEEEELDEVFGKAMKMAKGAAGRLGLTRGNKGGPSAGPGIADDEVAMAAASKLSNAAALKSQLKRPQVQQALRQIAATLEQQGTPQMKARFLGLLMVELGVTEDLATLIAGELRTASRQRAAKSDKLAASLPQKDYDDSGVNPSRPRDSASRIAGQPRYVAAEQIRRLKEELRRLESALHGKRRKTIRIKRKK